MADQNNKTSGELREAQRSSVIDQQLMSRSVSDNNDQTSEGDAEGLESDLDEEELPSQPGEDYADIREQQNQARTEQAAQENNQDSNNNSPQDNGIAGKVGSMLGGGKGIPKSPQEMIKKEAEKKIKLWIFGSVASCCLPGCLMIAGFLVTATIMLTILADPMKVLGLAFDAVWTALKAAVGAVTDFFVSS
ncbi:MAG: hypothetical protein ACOYMB_03915 [Patescibacteria group bacterium]